MKEYDVIVIGSGAGAIVVEQALAHGLSVALVDKGPLGGTCLNVGCIPTKMLIFPADRVVEIQEAAKLGIHAEIKQVDFQAIMERMKRTIEKSQTHIREGIEHTEELDFYEGLGSFADDYTLEVEGERIKGRKIFITSGARPLIPPIKGIENVDYLTNENVLDLTRKPESLIIIGGGYIAAEFGHFFASMRTKVTILQRAGRLVRDEEPEVSELLKTKMGKRMDIFTNTEAREVKRGKEEMKVITRDKVSGEEREFSAERILLAAGRKSNADLLKVEKTGVKVDQRGYIAVNDYLETSKVNIWAFGDAIGKKMFRHSANREADLVWHNAIHGERNKVDYDKVPHAVFSYPQVASVGLGEEEARKNHDILVGKAKYSEVAKGEAMMEEDSFAKIIIEKNSGRILGFHVIGPYAPILIQEVINAMSIDGTVRPIINGMHIHPALPEVIQSTLGNLQELRKKG
ncbi:MAG: dihydrolipoyl dehydrogenase [Candidatus Aminicenantes bacterium]|nr:dihydrolipoyl dehydrogenase [Candidatus Aminicenantes bacterium]